MSSVRTSEDMERAVRAIARHFKSDAVFIIGSQSVILEWPSAPVLLRTSGEIDAYPGNAEEWEAENPIEASEEISALFGWGSHFQDTHGFYIDGVDRNTAVLPEDWMHRCIKMHVDVDGRRVTAIAPSPEDLAAAKLIRYDDKDLDYVRERDRFKPLDRNRVIQSLEDSSADPALISRARSFVLNM
ncbi:DUF6036 family nucleotidyltransferase [Thioclava litoralis]|uniref:DUF6036 family nucleotidyltransferase n=1 Tax=Thioclava litoralis TaxID=3076557 RepID=A0ABZ1DW16_9RHOB|nr:DUF6036 family nucleotidyltransferase [Thioclava sp. FTW29]